MNQKPKLFRTAMKVGAAIAIGRVTYDIVLGACIGTVKGIRDAQKRMKEDG